MRTEAEIREAVKPRVFISHASKDKRRFIRPIVDGLLRLGFDLFVDSPNKLPRGLEDLSNRVDFIRPGANWRSELERGLRESDIVIGCFSNAMLLDRRVLQDEISYAKIASKLVACVIDGVAPEKVAKGGGLIDLGEIQKPEIRARALGGYLAIKQPWRRKARDAQEAAWGELLFVASELIRRFEEQDPAEAGRAGAPQKPPFIVTDAQLCRIDRELQRTGLFEQIGKTRRSGAPHAAVLAGPANELVSEFIRQARIAEKSEEFLAKRVAWPDTRGIVPFDTQYRQALAKSLNLPRTANDAELAEAIADAQEVIAPYSYTSSAALTLDCLKAFDEWLDFWRRLHQTQPQLRIAPTLLIELPKALPAHWSRAAKIQRSFPRSRRRMTDWLGFAPRAVSNRMLMQRLETMARDHAAADVMSVAFPDVVGPLNAVHVTDWCAEDAALLPQQSQFSKLFAGKLPGELADLQHQDGLAAELRDAARHGLSMETFQTFARRLGPAGGGDGAAT